MITKETEILNDKIIEEIEEIEDTFNYNIKFNFENESIKKLIIGFFDAWFNMIEFPIQDAPSGEWEEYNIEYIKYEMIYCTFKDILNDLKFNIVEEKDLIKVFYNDELVDFCEIITREEEEEGD